jgi:hypothetical protein
MDLTQQLQRHQQMAKTLSDAIKSGDRLDAFTIARPLLCTMGDWLHNEAKDVYGDIVAVRELVQRHHEFHKAAGEVAQAINGHRSDVQRMVAPGSNFVIALNGLEMALLKLNRAAKAA